MCGIVGVINSNGAAADVPVLEKMNRCIEHRGPDDDGFYIKENVGLAMRRLSIIDVAHGKQPMHNQDKTAWIVFNGEIYNFQELRADLEKQGDRFYTHSDTEVILHLYDKYGVDCVQHLRGMFAFAIWDEREKSLFIARDRVGKKPLLYSHRSNGDLIFGSEFRSLLAHPAISREVDYEAIHHYLTFLCVPAPLTAYQQIRKLEPAHWLRWKNGEVETKCYWSLDFSKKIKITQPEAEEETLRILREATRLRMIAEVPLGAFLSGGVDSSAVVALMAQESAKPIKTFSIGFEEQDFSELKYAKKVAEHIGAEHHEFIVKPNALEVLPILVEHYGEPYADSSAIPTYYVARETRKHVTVALNGDGGDESFGGYERYVAMNMANKYQRLPLFFRQQIIEKIVNAIPAQVTKRNLTRNVKGFVNVASMPPIERYLRLVSSFSKQIQAETYTEQFQHEMAGKESVKFIEPFLTQKNLTLVDAMLLADIKTYLPNDLLVKVDIASMAVSLEARSPLLDHHLIEFAASLPDKFKINGLQTKYLLKKVASRLVPKEVIYRKKMGFGIPLTHWFRGELNPFLREVLLSEKSLQRGIIKPEIVKKLVETHTNAVSDNTFQLWTLLMLELWFNRFID